MVSVVDDNLLTNWNWTTCDTYIRDLPTFRTSTKDTSAFQHVGSGSFCEDGGDLLEGRQKPNKTSYRNSSFHDRRNFMTSRSSFLEVKAFFFGAGKMLAWLKTTGFFSYLFVAWKSPKLLLLLLMNPNKTPQRATFMDSNCNIFPLIIHGIGAF